MDLIQAMKQRHAVRSYIDKKIEGETAAQLQNKIAEINEESGLKLQLVLNEEKAFGGRMAHYGHFENDIFVKKDTLGEEEKSIISYDELLKANLDPDELDNYRIEDEGNEPITLDELYKKNIDDLIEKQEEKINNFNKVQELKEEPKRFKNSSVISPVFGIKSDNEYKKIETYKNTNVKNIEDEIKKTEEFLSELKKLKERIEK